MAFWKKRDEEENRAATSSNERKLTEPTVVQGATRSNPPPANSRPSPSSSSTSSSASSAADNYDEGVDYEQYGKVRSALGPGTVIQGKLSFDTPVRIDGKLSGEIFSTKALIVGPQGWIDAQVEVAALIVMGTVKGDVKASEKIELHKGANLNGNITTPALVMSEGAIFNGSTKMTKASSVAVSSSGGNTPNKGETTKGDNRVESKDLRGESRSAHGNPAHGNPAHGNPAHGNTTNTNQASQNNRGSNDSNNKNGNKAPDKGNNEKGDNQKGAPQKTPAQAAV